MAAGSHDLKNNDQCALEAHQKKNHDKKQALKLNGVIMVSFLRT